MRVFGFLVMPSPRTTSPPFDLGAAWWARIAIKTLVKMWGELLSGILFPHNLCTVCWLAKFPFTLHFRNVFFIISIHSPCPSSAPKDIWNHWRRVCAAMDEAVTCTLSLTNDIRTNIGFRNCKDSCPKRHPSLASTNRLGYCRGGLPCFWFYDKTSTSIQMGSSELQFSIFSQRSQCHIIPHLIQLLGKEKFGFRYDQLGCGLSAADDTGDLPLLVKDLHDVMLFLKHSLAEAGLQCAVLCWRMWLLGNEGGWRKMDIDGQISPGPGFCFWVSCGSFRGEEQLLRKKNIHCRPWWCCCDARSAFLPLEHH